MNDEKDYPYSNLQEPWTIYPEMLEWNWVKDFDRMKEEGKREGRMERRGGLMSEMPRVKINDALNVIKEILTQPEIVAAFASAPLNGQIPPKEAHILAWYREYMNYKYGNWPSIFSEVKITMRKLANGFYVSAEDPKLREDLMSQVTIIE